MKEGTGTLEDKKATFMIKYPENDEDCFASTGNLVFDQTVVAMFYRDTSMQLHSIRKYSIGVSGAFVEDDERGVFLVYEEPIPGEEYVVPQDTAKGVAKGDYSVLYVMNKKTFAVAARMRIHCAPEIFGMFGVYIAHRYNDALLVPEKNDRGHVTVQKAVNMKYPHIYFDGMERGMKLTEFGFGTNEKTKKLVVEQLVFDVRMGAFQKLPLGLVEEMTWYIQKPNGSYGAVVGKKDDEVMTMAIGLYMCYLFPYHYRRNGETRGIMDYVEGSSILNRRTGIVEEMGAERPLTEFGYAFGNMEHIRSRFAKKKKVVSQYSKGGRVNVIY
jgi:hypothetical protein